MAANNGIEFIGVSKTFLDFLKENNIPIVKEDVMHTDKGDLYNVETGALTNEQDALAMDMLNELGEPA